MSKTWMTTAEAAKILGCSQRAVRKGIATGRYQARQVPGIGGRGLIWEVCVADQGTTEPAKKTKEPRNQSTEPRNLTKEPAKLHKNKLLTRTKSRKVSDRCNKTQNTQQVVIKRDTNLLQRGATNGATNVVDIEKAVTPCNFKDYEQAHDWIDKESAATLLDITRQGIDRKIESHNWPTVTLPRPNGGSKVFLPVTLLPVAQQQVWKEHQLTRWQPNLPALQQQERQTWEQRPDKDRQEARARLAIVQEWRAALAAAKQNGVKVSQAERSFERALSDLRILPQQTSILGGRVSTKTIRRWDKMLRDEGMSLYPVALLPGKSQGRPPIRLDKTEMNSVSVYVAKSTLDMAKMYRRLVDGEWGGSELISYSTFVRRFKPDAVLQAFASGPKAVNDKLRPHVFISKQDLQPGDIWLGDGHRMNNACQSPFWRHRNPKFRHMIHPYIHMWIDQYTWTVTGWTLAATENTHSVMVSFGLGVERFGAPKHKIRSDNGPAWKNIEAWPEYFACRKRPNAKAVALMAEGYQGFYREMCDTGVEFAKNPVKRSNGIPGRSESKEIENAFHTILEEFEQTVSLWTGHNKNDVPERLQGKMTKKLTNQVLNELLPWDEYVAALTEHIERWNHTPRVPAADGSLLSPIEAYATVSHPRVPKEQILDVFFRYPVQATITRDGINFNGIPYWHDDFFGRAGQKVKVHYLEHMPANVRIADNNGNIWKEPAYAIPQSSHVNNQKASEAISERKRAFKRSLGKYAERHGAFVEMMDDQGRAQVEAKERGTLPQPKTTKAIAAPEPDPLTEALAKKRLQIPAKAPELNEQEKLEAALDKLINYKRLGVG